MPYAPHIRMTANGVFLNTTEQWSFGVNIGNEGVSGFDAGAPGLEPNAVVWNDLADDVSEFHAGNTFVSGLAQLRSVKFAFIGADGKYTREPIIRERISVGGGGATYFMPTQVALAVTLLTNTPLTKVRGRFYLPGMMYGVETDGRISAVRADFIRSRVDTFLEAVGNQPGMDVLNLKAIVASTKGNNHTVSAVKVGRVYDTIRSRRNRLLEAYSDPAAVSSE